MRNHYIPAHAENALIPIITAVGLQFGNLLGGAMLAETIFSWPGLGRLMVESIKSKGYSDGSWMCYFPGNDVYPSEFDG